MLWTLHAYFAQDSPLSVACIAAPLMSVGHHRLMLFELHRSLLLLRNRARELRHEVSQPRSMGVFDESHPPRAALRRAGRNRRPNTSRRRTAANHHIRETRSLRWRP